MTGAERLEQHGPAFDHWDGDGGRRGCYSPSMKGVAVRTSRVRGLAWFRGLMQSCVNRRRDQAYDLLDLLEELHEAFDVLDEDDDGTISQFELRKVLDALGHSADEQELCGNARMYNEKGRITFDEFHALVTGVRPHGLDARTVAAVSDAALGGRCWM